MNLPDSFTRQLGPGGLEMRALPSDSSQVAAAETEGAPIVRGYGAVFNVWTTIGGEHYGFDEMFAPGCWDESLGQNPDVRSMFNHETCQLLGRTKSGTLRLAVDNVGLAYEVDINPDDPQAMSTHAKVQRKDVDGSSVWFRCIEDRWEYPDGTNGLERERRTIVRAALIETGPVTFPAYEDAESSSRSLRPFDVALRAAGMKSDQKRAMLAVDLLTAPDDAAEQIRTLFARTPELRESVCACEIPGPAADSAPEDTRAADSAPEPQATPSQALALAKARLAVRLKQPA